MKAWVLIALILTLALGLSTGGLLVRLRPKLWDNMARYFLIGLFGAAISAVIMVLIIIAVWPPYNFVSFILTLGFLALILGVLYFVRSTNTSNLNGEGE